MVTLRAMRDLAAAFLNVTIRLYLNLQQVVGLQKDLEGKEVLNPCKSIDLQSIPAPGVERRNDCKGWQLRVGTCKLYKHATPVISLT